MFENNWYTKAKIAKKVNIDNVKDQLDEKILVKISNLFVKKYDFWNKCLF